MFMNFCVAPREIREINKRGGQNKLRGVSKNHEKMSVPPVYFEPENIKINRANLAFKLSVSIGDVKFWVRYNSITEKYTLSSSQT